MIDLTEKVKGVSCMEYFPTGSALVRSVEPGDIDIVCLFSDAELINEFVNSSGSDKELYGDSQFVSVRNGKINYLCTADLEFFYRFKAYSGVLSRLQLEDKADRIEMAKACLYWEYNAIGGDAA